MTVKREPGAAAIKRKLTPGRVRTATAKKEQSAKRGAMMEALRMSGYNTDSKGKDGSGKWVSGDGAKTIAPAQYGNLKVSKRNAARNFAFGNGIPLAKKGK